MEIKDAVLIVLELARQNALTDRDAAGDDALTAEQQRQQQALDMVTRWTEGE
jgi:hypothetical protein